MNTGRLVGELACRVSCSFVGLFPELLKPRTLPRNHEDAVPIFDESAQIFHERFQAPGEALVMTKGRCQINAHFLIALRDFIPLPQGERAHTLQLVAQFRPAHIWHGKVRRNSALLDGRMAQVDGLMLDLLHHPVDREQSRRG